MNVYRSLDQMIRAKSKNNAEYQKWKEQITLFFEGHLLYFEIDREARKAIVEWERNYQNV